VVDVPTSTRLTAAEVARELNLDIETVLDLVYRGELDGHPDADTGRIWVTADALTRYRDRARL
jgi:hypothetical protein